VPNDVDRQLDSDLHLEPMSGVAAFSKLRFHRGLR